VLRVSRRDDDIARRLVADICDRSVYDRVTPVLQLDGVKAIKMIRNDFATKYNQRPGLKESKDDIDNLLGKWPR
jgi:hypothetical protein